jgi:hypothetical protein
VAWGTLELGLCSNLLQCGLVIAYTKGP